MIMLDIHRDIAKRFKEFNGAKQATWQVDEDSFEE